ncbi:class I SAM-dependent methyltransferase [Kordiimonas marina]|uniref:class I SAM-dependent methyltransferase n=1 Tax=Kordiimonas marina TaxID=2872312 RepID=UPI001FF6E774|nr:class I SAM-dependent methyltransferase [Kordiimonas marina]MCJ9428395.1 class I SAM-dependent methyltransferase [Kordiimonas marina]
MRPDVLGLYRFYQTPLGRGVADAIGARLSRMWLPGTGQQTIGFGFALPYLDKVKEAEGDQASRYLAFMPAQQGVCHWPQAMGSSTALVEEYNLPLADSSVDRFLLIHALEHANRPANLLREVWRVLAPGGQVIAVVPNRRRTWSAVDATPFGHGRPYSKGQLYELMDEQMLPPEGWDTALMLPPFGLPGMPRLMRMTERTIHALGRNLGGALIVCARKQVYGAVPKAEKRARIMPVLTGS